MLFVKDKTGYKQVTAAELIKKLESAHDQISTATEYSGQLKHGSGCDSSDDSPFRMAYVMKAEEAFIKANQGVILAQAAALVQADIDALKAR